MPVKVLFVCLGNICRSPAAESILNHVISTENLEGKVIVDSAGTGGYHTGEMADPRMISAGEKRGYKFLSKARKVYPEQDFREFDYILAADRSNYENLRRMMTHENELDGKLFMICDFCQNANADEVPDPYFGGEDGFETVLDLLEDACAGFVSHLRSKNPTW